MSLAPLLDRIHRSAEYERGLECLKRDRAPLWLEGLAGTAKTYVAAALQRHLQRVLLIVTAHEDAAERIAADLTAFGFNADQIGMYPDLQLEQELALPDSLVLSSSLDPEKRAYARSRIAVLEALAEGRLAIVVAPVSAVLRETYKDLSSVRISLVRGERLNIQELSRQLVDVGYERTAVVEQPGQFAVRGGLVDVWAATQTAPARAELFGDEIESIRPFDPETQLSSTTVDRLVILPARDRPEGARSTRDAATILNHLPPGSVVVLDEPNHIRSNWLEAVERRRQDESEAKAAGREIASVSPALDLEELFERVQCFRLVLLTLLAQTLPWLRKVQEQSERISLNSGVLDSVHSDFPLLANRVRSLLSARCTVAISSDQPHRIVEVLVEHEIPATSDDRSPMWGMESTEAAGGKSHPDPVFAAHGRLSAGFRLDGIKLVVLSDAELLGRAGTRHRPRDDRYTRRLQEGRPILSLLELKEGDLVVHITHGIGRYRGLVRRTVNLVEREFLRIDYHEPDKLFVPSDQLDRVQKYIGQGEGGPNIHRLGGAEWSRTKARVRAKVREMAKELIQLYAQREAAKGHAFSIDGDWQEEMEAAFPYRETRDQLRAIRDAKRDMERERPMDRLICGDVGYGKTEVAIRAAFKAVADGKQVALLVPTTVLAQQHYQTFTERLAAFPVRVDVMSRFRSRLELKGTLQRLKDGQVDILIGTHRILSKDVQFVDLGLLIVDEEHRFGVAHKERLKQLRQAVDVLTLTATPIPRTLHMSLSGIRDMSVIEEPPEGRLAVRTFCVEAADRVIRDAVLRELDRGGQLYFIHNRIDTIYREAERLRRLVPQARFRVGHGQMKDSELEEVMLGFYEGEFDILLCTTIVESGLDVPNANTILINHADHLGLAQLHQLRGRVGRSARQAYCYLMYQPYKQLTENAEKRLEAIREFTDLGAGFNIAMRDMEIRGAGNLLGAEQHGNMASVGFDLYCQMIEEEVKSLRGEATDEMLFPSVNLPVSAFIPEAYIPTEALRIAIYKRVAGARSAEALATVQRELEDRFGDPPKPVWNLLAVMRLRFECMLAGVARIEMERESVVFWMARRVGRDEVRELYQHHRRAQFMADRILLHFDGDSPLRPAEELVRRLQRHGGKEAAGAVQKTLQAAAAVEPSPVSR